MTLNIKPLNPTLKHALVAVLLGAMVSFVSSLLEGLLKLLQSGAFDFSGGLVSSLWYLRILKKTPL